MVNFTVGKVTGDSLAATEWNQNGDVNNFVTDSGQTATTGDLNQISKGVSIYAAGGDYYTDGGAANAYVLSVVGSKKAPPVYFDGMRARFRPGNDNADGASTVNPASLGVKSIKMPDGTTNPPAGYISTDFDVTIRYDLGNDVFIIVSRDGFINQLSNPNLIINGQGVIAQRGTSFTSSGSANNDDTYNLDRSLLVSSANDAVDITQETTTVPTGAPSCIKYDQETGSEQWGYVQILEAKDAAAIIGGVASLQFKARKGGSNSTLETLRAAIISWSSTADSVTSDVVGTWAGAGTNPTLASNWTYENTPSSLTLTTSFQTFKIENIAIDTASTTNVGVFIWLDDTDATIGDLAYIGDIKLEEGAVCTPFKARPVAEESTLCKRYYEYGSFRDAVGGSTSGNSIGGSQQFAVEKRSTPTLTLSGTANTNSSNTSLTNLGTTGLYSNGDTTGSSAAIQSGNWTADCEL